MSQPEELQNLIQAIRRAREGNVAVEIPHISDPTLAPLADELRALFGMHQVSHAREVEQQRDLYLRILDQLPADIALIDSQSRYLFLSRCAIKDPELRKWLIGKTDYDYCNLRGIDTSLAQQRQESHRMAFETKRSCRVVEVRTDREGKTVHKLRFHSPILDDDGKPFMIVGFGYDITELAETEQALRDQNEALEKANYELDQFVYRASHDLRAPLSSVQGLIELAFGLEPSDKLVQLLQLMQRATAKLDHFIRDIVDHSKNARQELHFEEVDLAAEVEDTKSQLAYMTGAGQVEIQVNLDLQAPLHTDKFRLSVVLNNLISNGIKYHDPKKTHPFVRLDARVTHETVELIVSDNGIGIGQAHLSHVFEMFYRATNSATGTGIGLYIVQEIAHKLGGKASVSATLGEGTTFTVSFLNRIPLESPST